MNFEPLYSYVYVLGLIVGLLLYVVPSLVAVGKESAGRVIALNLLIGWTIVGWVLALAWAVRLPRKPGPEHRLSGRCAAI
jgi:hypothetical protein